MTLSFDKLALNHQVLLALPFEEGIRLVTHDNAKPHHILTLTGTPPTWNSLPSGLPYISFDGAADYLQCPAADSVDLDFTGDFSLAAWVNPNYTGSAMVIMCRNATDVCGWCMWLYNNPTHGPILSLRTNQGAPGDHCECWGGNFPGGVWQLAGYSRSQAGASAICYKNGVALVTHPDPAGMLDPVAGAKKLLIGVQDGEASNFFKGGIAGGPCGPRAWDRELSPSEWKEMFEQERHWFP